VLIQTTSVKAKVLIIRLKIRINLILKRVKRLKKRSILLTLAGLLKHQRHIRALILIRHVDKFKKE
jgi:hypothetical protein